MPAVPALIMGGTALVGSLMGDKSRSDTAKELSQRTPEELALMKSQTGLADQQRSQGSQLFAAGMPAITNTVKYYQTLLGGNRTARMNAVAPEAQDTAAAYQGADLALQRSGARGGERAQAQAENSRSKAGAVARLVTGVRPQAAAALGAQGQGLVGASTAANASAGGIYGNLLGADQQNRQQANTQGLQQGNKTSSNMGSLFARLIGNYPGLGKGKWGFGDSGGGDGGNSQLDL